MGGMCCRNGGYVSVEKWEVCVVEMWGMYQLQIWGYVLQKWGVQLQDLDMCQLKLCNGTCDVM